MGLRLVKSFVFADVFGERLAFGFLGSLYDCVLVCLVHLVVGAFGLLAHDRREGLV